MMIIMIIICSEGGTDNCCGGGGGYGGVEGHIRFCSFLILERAKIRPVFTP